ncbi:MAG TPA: FAD-linked oxidase C-terminal domain-containing protein [Terriglobia bacterium]|nr:FAD-linked oxidase C-terminal domain-containing protein [Terriglobia bacterium]
MSASERQRKAIAAALQKRIEGEVRFDEGSRALYATDLSIYRHVPVGVVIPRHMQDVMDTVAICREYGAPILGRGTGTSLAGQTCNAGVIIDFSKHINGLIELNPGQKWARVEPGPICDQLRDAAKPYGLTFAPDPATHAYCTLGGMIGNNSCGVHSVMGGRTVDNVEELEVLTYDGLRLTVGPTSDHDFERIVASGGRRAEIYRSLHDLRDKQAGRIRRRYPKIPRRVSGYNLDELLPERGFHIARSLVGSESTCVLVLNAKLRLLDDPPQRVLLVIGYPDIFLLGDEVPFVRSFGPIGLECLQQHVLRNLERKGQPHLGSKFLPDGDAWLLAEFGGDTKNAATQQAQDAIVGLQKRGTKASGLRLLDDPYQQKLVWHLREGGVAASRVPGEEDAWPSWEDAAVDPAVLGDYLRDFYRLTNKFKYSFSIYGHFGDGCIHTRITFDLKTREGVRNFRRFMESAADLVVKYKGSLSGEHGDGQARAELLPKMFGRRLVRAFQTFKSIWDPQWKMNPGKIVDPMKLDENLRLGPGYRPKQYKTHFKFPEDHGSLAEATERCFGIGKCRELGGATMCPSFQVTRDEMHTTRGRAHLLFEMLRGDSIPDGWRSEHVKEALDLCLSCKGCKSDCPINVDMATYKAEFLSHYWEGRVRPALAYALGYIDRWAQMASSMPGAANLVTQNPALNTAFKKAIGIALQRDLPAIAPQTLQAWFSRRVQGQMPGGDVLLWPDTFNNFFHPEVGQAAVEVLETAGFQVEMPLEHVCCGRPLYDFGFLNEAENYLRRVLRVLRPVISAGTPIVVLEPSCASVFRDEMLNLLPRDEQAQRLSKQVFLLSEFLEQRQKGDSFPALRRDAIVHAHCHQKSILGADAMSSTLHRLGLNCDVLNSGCCGMAGSFGFEREKYEVSVACGERVLLPAVRNAGMSALIIADGFSCREQIRQCTDRHALHLAQVLQMALHQEKRPIQRIYPEREMVEARASAVHKSMSRTSMAAAASAGAAALAFLLTKSRQRVANGGSAHEEMENKSHRTGT